MTGISHKFWDAVTAEEFPARAEELAFIEDWYVWDVVPLKEC